MAVAVADVKRTMRFYQQVFEMEAMYLQEGFVQLTTPGCNDILVFEENTGREIGNSAGIAHFGFRLKAPGDIVGYEEKIVTAGGTITSKGEFVPGSPFIFFRDPDGYEVEIWYELLGE